MYYIYTAYRASQRNLLAPSAVIIAVNSALSHTVLIFYCSTLCVIDLWLIGYNPFFLFFFWPGVQMKGEGGISLYTLWHIVGQPPGVNNALHSIALSRPSAGLYSYTKDIIMFPLSPFSVMGHFSVGPPLTAHFWPFFTWLDSLSLSPRYWLLLAPIGDPLPWTAHGQQGTNRARYRSNRWIIKCIFARVCVCVFIDGNHTAISSDDKLIASSIKIYPIQQM